MDALLLPFAKARDEAEAERHLEQVISLHARPLIQTILRGKLGSARGGMDTGKPQTGRTSRAVSCSRSSDACAASRATRAARP